MRRWVLCATLALAGCKTIASPVMTTIPILLGPIDRIGGQPTPEAAGEPQWDGEDEMSLTVCVQDAYPVVIATQPQGGAPILKSLQDAVALQAGKQPLHQLNPRLTAYRTGAWVYFLAGCYGHSWWWVGRGVIEAAR